MQRKPFLKPGLFLLPLLPLALFLASCNIFGQAGEDADTADEFILDGEGFLRKAEYEKALDRFEKALAKDSSKSEAYYGAAKAWLLSRRINMFKLVLSFQENEPGQIPFLSEADSVKDAIYGANRGINRYLTLFLRRENAGRTDGKVLFRQLSADYALSSAIEAILSLADFNGDGRIDAKDNILSGIIDFTDPTRLNPDSIMKNIADLKNDTVKIQALNGLLDKSTTLLEQSDKAIDLFLTKAFDSTTGGLASCPVDSVCGKVNKDQIGDSAVLQVKKFIGEAGSTILIYKVMDGADNDGDGCADEELLDGADNDGDGLTDEDSRGAPDTTGNPKFRADKDGADNDGKGGTDDTGEVPFHSRYLFSMNPANFVLQPFIRGRIFYRDSAGPLGQKIFLDTRDTVFIPLDSLDAAAGRDTVVTFDLCRGKVTGFKKR